MKEEKLGSEPAFPNEHYDQTIKGISKRFYTACIAMQGILASTAGTDDFPVKEIVARISFEFADELLKQENGCI
jgi:hypothetical protein